MASTIPFGDQPPIVGRQREQAQLRTCLEIALDGHGGLVLVSGEAGIGKTTLVQDLVQHAEEQDCLVLTGGCYDLTTTPPYGPWMELFGDYPNDGDVPTLPEPLRAGEEPAEIASSGELFELVARFLIAVSDVQSLMLVLEDIHWADPSSIELLRYLSRIADEHRLLLIATYRDEEIPKGHLLFDLLPLLVRESVTARVTLRRWNRDDTGSLIRLRYPLGSADEQQLIPYVQDLSEGNPFYVEELLGALEHDGVLQPDNDHWRVTKLPDAVVMPPLVGQVIERRLSSLSAETRAALDVAAVIGQRIRLALWSSIGGLDRDALDKIIREALEMRVLVEDSHRRGLQFSHALLREVLYERVPLSRRRHWHRQIGELLADAERPDPDAVADHFQQAGDNRALAWLLRGGIRVHRSSAWLIAADRFQRAAAWLEGDDQCQSERGWLLYRVGELLRFSDTAQAIACFDEALRLAAVSGDEALQAYALHRRGTVRCISSDFRRGIRDIERGVASLQHDCGPQESLPPPQHIQRALQSLLGDADVPVITEFPFEQMMDDSLGSLMMWYAVIGRYTDALELVETTAPELFVSADAEPGSGHARFDGGPMLELYAALGRVDEAWQIAETTRQNRIDAHNYYVTDLFSALTLLFIILPYRTDRLEERSRIAADASEARSRATELMTTTAQASACTLLLDVLEGRWLEARDLAKAGLSAPSAAHVMSSVICLGYLAREQGDPKLAWEQVRSQHPEGPRTEPGGCYFLGGVAMQRLAVHLALDDEDHETARAWLEAHDRWLDWSGTVLGRAERELLWARFHRCAGDIEQARLRATAALEQASEPRQPPVLITAHRFLGEINIRTGQYADASDHLRESLELAERCEAPHAWALTMLTMAELYTAQKRVDLAVTSIEQVREICEPMEAHLALSRANAIEAWLEHLQVEYPNGLTPREAEVLSLMAAGKSNREMADELYLSIRTVERHVSNIYRKIGTHNRTDATRYALQHSIIELTNT